MRPDRRGASPPPRGAAELRVVYEDGALAIVDKPAGLLSQAGPRDASPSVVELARARFGLERIGVLHRLDRNVSGLVLVPLDASVAASLSRALAEGRIERRYEAVVKAPRASELVELVIDAPLAKDERTNVVRVAHPDDPGARAARTRVALRERVQAPLGWLARVDCWPITGRSHQLRVHLAHAGLPIVGDPKYGVRAKGIERPLLHATGLAFVHPETGREVRVESSPPWTLASLRGLRAGAGREAR